MGIERSRSFGLSDLFKTSQDDWVVLNQLLLPAAKQLENIATRCKFPYTAFGSTSDVGP